MAIAGYGRHDSMQHGAKHSAYTIFSCTIPMIVFFFSSPSKFLLSIPLFTMDERDLLHCQASSSEKAFQTLK